MRLKIIKKCQNYSGEIGRLIYASGTLKYDVEYVRIGGLLLRNETHKMCLCILVYVTALYRLLRDINENAQAAVRVCGQEGSWFATSRGTRQGDQISPTVFIADLEKTMDKVKDGEEGISVHRIKINNLQFADDIDIIDEDESSLERTVHSLHKEAMMYCLLYTSPSPRDRTRSRMPSSA